MHRYRRSGRLVIPARLEHDRRVEYDEASSGSARPPPPHPGIACRYMGKTIRSERVVHPNPRRRFGRSRGDRANRRLFGHDPPAHRPGHDPGCRSASCPSASASTTHPAPRARSTARPDFPAPIAPIRPITGLTPCLNIVDFQPVGPAATSTLRSTSSFIAPVISSRRSGPRGHLLRRRFEHQFVVHRQQDLGLLLFAEAGMDREHGPLHQVRGRPRISMLIASRSACPRIL